MAFALKGTGSASTANSTTANQASLVVTTATTAGAAGDLAILIYAVDNNQTTDGDEGAVTAVVDSGGNQWREAVEFTNGQGTAQTGATCGIWYCNLRAAIATGGTVTLTFSNAASRDASAASLTYYTKAAGFNAELAGVPGTLANDAAAAGSLNVTTPNIACLRVRGIASESSTVTALTPTATFAIVTQAVAVLAAATSMGVRGEWVINTGTGTASAPTAGAGAVDNASVYAAFLEAPTTDWIKPLSEPPVMKRRKTTATVSAWVGDSPDFIRNPWPTPTRMSAGKRLFATALIAAGVFAPVFTPPPEVDVDSWLRPLSEPVPAKRGLARHLHDHSTDVYPVTAENITVDKWFNPLSDPVRRIRAPNKVNLFPFTAATTTEDVTVDKWFDALSEPTRTKISVTAAPDQAWVPIVTAEVITVDKWLASWSEPPRVASTIYPNQSYMPLVAEVVTADKWFDAFSEPARGDRFNVALQPSYTTEYFPDAPNANAGQWFGSFSEPARVKSRFSALYQAYTTEYFPDTFTQWFTPFSEPTRIDRSLNTTDQGVVPYVAEIVTVDKWFDSLSEPTRIDRFNAALQASYTTEYFPEAFGQWFTPLSEPVRERGFRAPDQSSVPYLATEIVTVDKWFDVLSEPIRDRRFNAPDQSVVPYVVSEVVTVDKWFDALSEPVRLKRFNPALQAVHTTEYFPEAFGEWFTPLSEPVRIRSRSSALQQAYTAGYVSLETITVDKWFDPLSEPVRTKPGLRTALQPVSTQDTVFVPDPSGYLEGWYGGLSEPVRQKAGLRAAQQPELAVWPLTTPEVVTVDKWYAALSMPVRQKLGLLAATQSAYTTGYFSFEVVSVDKWYASLSEPKRFRSGLHASLQQTVTQDTVFIPNPSQYGGWYGALSEPPRQRGLKAAHQVPNYNSYVVVAAEIVTVDKWFRQLVEPTLAKSGDADLYKGENDWTATIDMVEWFSPLTEPVRTKPGLASARQTAFFAYPGVAAAEVVTVDKWFEQLSDPTRRKPEDRARYKAENEWTAIAASMKWFRPLEDPWREKPGLSVAVIQPALTLPAQTFTPSVAGWWQPLSDPPKAKAGLKAANQRFDTRSTVFIPNPNQFLEGWFNWFSEPVRFKQGLSVELQSFWTGSNRILANTVTVTMNATETGIDVAIIAVRVLPSNPPATAVVSLVEIGDDGSLTSLVEEGDDGSGTSVVET